MVYKCSYNMCFPSAGFGSDSNNPHLPHNHEGNQVVYTGTHDNDTVKIVYTLDTIECIALQLSHYNVFWCILNLLSKVIFGKSIITNDVFQEF